MVEVLDRIAECASRPRRATLAASASQGSSILRIFVEQEFSSFRGSEFICLAAPPDPYLGVRLNDRTPIDSKCSDRVPAVKSECCASARIWRNFVGSMHVLVAVGIRDVRGEHQGRAKGRALGVDWSAVINRTPR